MPEANQDKAGDAELGNGLSKLFHENVDGNGTRSAPCILKTPASGIRKREMKGGYKDFRDIPVKHEMLAEP